MSLRAFLEQMEEKKEMIHIKDSVSTNFEIAYIMKSFDGNGPVLLFENVEDAKARIVANVCGTRKRICEALNVDQDRLYKRLLEAWQSPRKPRIVDDGPVKEVIEEPDLLRIPVLTHFERDAGPYITAAVVHAKSLDGNIENVSVHRLQVLDERHLAIRLVPRHLYKLWNMAKEAETDLDIAIAIGVHPAVMLA
ncbi:MAG: UbiD family decarboxylase, partial [Candidatus Bathyarchaeia archaeon]